MLVVVAVGALGFGLAVGSGRDSDAERTAKQFAAAWNREDYRSMHALLDEDSRRRYPLATFRKIYEDAAGTATATSARVGDPRGSSGNSLRIPVVVATRIFGEVRGQVALPIDESGVGWSPHLAFPGSARANA